MSDNQPTQTGDLGEQPEPVTEPGEPNPGGPDALPDDEQNLSAEREPGDNPAVGESPDQLREVLAEREDTETEATRSADGSDDDVEPEDDSPA